MKKISQLEFILQRQALDEWINDCKRKMGVLFPKIDFDSISWPIKTIYKTEQCDFYFNKSINNFKKKDSSYLLVLRCLVAEMVIAGKPKVLKKPISAFRLLAKTQANTIFELTVEDLRALETDILKIGRINPTSAETLLFELSKLKNQIDLLSSKGILPKLGFYIRNNTKVELNKIGVAQRARTWIAKENLLNHKIEAFNEAFNIMLENPQKNGEFLLSPIDRTAICMVGLLFCAPSRINEILCMSIDDFVTIQDYAEKKINQEDIIHRAHQMLIVTMKGSKGAEWSPKPVLSFMIDFFHYCLDIIKQNGKRSRMLTEWYSRHPNKIYLPPELEYLRGKNLNRNDVAKIIYLTETPKGRGDNFTVYKLFKALDKKKFKATNTVRFHPNGNIIPARKKIDFLKWNDVEEFLLKKIHKAMDDCRKVTDLNHFKGELSKMLFLFDREELPYLPYAIKYRFISLMLKRRKSGIANYRRPDNIFEKLNIKMPVDGKVQFAEIDSHDPRRWLTTMALIHGEKLSDVLINKWANRCNLSQLKAYDFRTSETIADDAAMPDNSRLNELIDLSNGLTSIENLEKKFGLQTIFSTAHDAGISVTSIDDIYEAIENRPVARTSRGVIVVYPQRFGICLHQHHEKPCRNYSNDLELSCMTCNEGIHVKGHFPSNEETRGVNNKIFKIILRHLENLAVTHNRNVADDPEALSEHMQLLIEKGLSVLQLEELANHLIDEFHQINHLLKDRSLAKRLEQAFVAREVVKRLDDSEVANGALIKYNSPKNHSDPLLEIALDQHGGREQVEYDEKQLVKRYPKISSDILNDTNMEATDLKMINNLGN